jgi:uncharacterized membrane protein
MHYFPLEWPILLGLFLLVSVIVDLVELRILHYAYERLGISPRSATWILVLTLVRRSINTRLAEFPPDRVISGRIVRHLACGQASNAAATPSKRRVHKRVSSEASELLSR